MTSQDTYITQSRSPFPIASLTKYHYRQMFTSDVYGAVVSAAVSIAFSNAWFGLNAVILTVATVNVHSSCGGLLCVAPNRTDGHWAGSAAVDFCGAAAVG